VVRQGEHTSRGEEEYYLGGDEWSERTIEPLMFLCIVEFLGTELSSVVLYLGRDILMICVH
jgi:hypothetical protein